MRSRSQKFLTFLKEKFRKYLRTWVSDICSEFSHFTQIIFFTKNFLSTYEKTKGGVRVPLTGYGLLGIIAVNWFFSFQFLFELQKLSFFNVMLLFKNLKTTAYKSKNTSPDKIFDHYWKLNDSACCAYTRCIQKLIQDNGKYATETIL